MDKSAIRNFAIEARKMLMKSAETEAGFYGVTKNGCKSPIQKGNDFEVYETIAGTENRIYGADIKRRENLVRAVETLGFEQVMEETAYTWFNRIIAIRFMEVNDYLPTRVRVLSSETGSNTPDIVTQSLDVDLNMAPEELDKVQKAKDENRYDDAFRMLFIKQCNELNAILPGLFEKTDDYMELLLKLSYTSDGVVRMLVDSIDENNFNVETEGQVEIIGWMYQYYNTELKDDTFAQLKKHIKIAKDRIPAATQLFTPDWIVRYLVENSVGRVWIEHLKSLDSSVDEKEKANEFGWKYYIAEAKQTIDVQNELIEVKKSYINILPLDITCIDPCMGSGHILVCMFDVLMDIYRSEGFNESEAVLSILKNNIRGLDIDMRAYQLSYFALMMKARGYNRTFFRGVQDENGERQFIQPAVYSIIESNKINRGQLKCFGATCSDIEKNNAINQICGLLDSLKNAKEYGSILEIDNYDWELLYRFLERYDIEGQISFDTYGIDETRKLLIALIRQGQVLADKYLIVATNPPYMALSNGNAYISDYVKKYYPAGKADLFAVFIERCMKYCKINGFQSMITQHAWMFLSTYEDLRSTILSKDIISLVHLGIKAFEEIGNDVVQTCAFVFANRGIEGYQTIFNRLVDYKDGYLHKEKEFFNVDNISVSNCSSFREIPGYSFAYWVSDNFISNFARGENIEKFASFTGSQNITGDNDKYLRCFWEIPKEKILANDWVFYAKGGDYRKYYGNLQLIVDWREGARAFYKSNKTSNLLSEDFWYKEGITYSAVTSRGTGFRYLPTGCIFDKGGPSICTICNNIELLALLNSKVAELYFKVLNPSINLQVKDIKAFPVIIPKQELIGELTEETLKYAKLDWDSHETSFGFERSPIIAPDSEIQVACKKWITECKRRFQLIKENERQVNICIADEYNMQNELDISFEERDIPVCIPDEKMLIIELISYAVGCMFGRYSLDNNGIIYAGGDWDNSKYSIFLPDADGIIPITDAEYFNDDIVAIFVEFIGCVFGEESLEKNLSYIAQTIGCKGNTSKEVIRNYFLEDFFKDHCTMYSITGTGKRPIYWLFDSGKQNGFKCLIYMHRYNKDTLNLIRSEYLHKTQNAVENALKNAEYIIQTSASAVERAKATKDKDRYVKQLNEMRIYYQALSHLALQKIEIDLDDGVKHNYQLFQGIEVIADGGKKQKVNLLAKI